MDAGYVLLIASAVPLAIGWDLSRRGLNEAEEVVATTKRSTDELRQAVADTQQKLAAAPPGQTDALAAANVETLRSASAVDNSLATVTDALSGLTGRLAPARVAFALAFLLVVGALFELDVITAAGNAAAGGAPAE